jgi:hypothetical protein
MKASIRTFYLIYDPDLRILETCGCYYDNKIPRSANQALAGPAKAHKRPHWIAGAKARKSRTRDGR